MIHQRGARLNTNKTPKLVNILTLVIDMQQELPVFLLSKEGTGEPNSLYPRH